MGQYQGDGGFRRLADQLDADGDGLGGVDAGDGAADVGIIDGREHGVGLRVLDFGGREANAVDALFVAVHDDLDGLNGHVSFPFG